MPSHILPLARLGRASPTTFDIQPDAEMRQAIAAELDLISLRKARLTGTLTAEGKQDWRLEARIGATAIQSCVVTLEPVTTRIDQPLIRHYRAVVPLPDAEEMEMPEDDSIEALPDTLDLIAVFTEALALALPDFPRAAGAELGEAVFAAPGVVPMTDEDAKPLAGLAALRDQLAPRDDGSEDDENTG